MVYKSILGATCACLAVVSINANADLVGRDLNGDLTTIEAYYDPDTDLTWLADDNYAATSGYAAMNATGNPNSLPTNIQTDGSMGWEAATAWAAGLTIGGNDNWRLPTTLQPDASCDSQSIGTSAGNNCTGSEMGNLFYNVLGNTVGPLINSDPFSHLQSNGWWSATDYTHQAGEAWAFFYDGLQAPFNKNNSLYAWAVHDGDIGTSAVPIPSAVWLFGSGLLGLIGLARRKSN